MLLRTRPAHGLRFCQATARMMDKTSVPKLTLPLSNLSGAALVMLRQPLSLPNHCTIIATEPGCDFFFGYFLFERKRK
jgi:hypothetical protein